MGCSKGCNMRYKSKPTLESTKDCSGGPRDWKTYWRRDGPCEIMGG